MNKFEDRLFRLTILLSILAAVSFAFVAVKNYRDELSFNKAAAGFLSLSQKNQNSCGEAKNLPCKNYNFASDPWVQMSQAANGAGDTWRVSLGAMIAVPVLLFGLFYSGRWVMHGGVKKSRAEA